MIRQRMFQAGSLVVLLLCAVDSLPAESAGGLQWAAPSGWQSQGPRPMRPVTYLIQAAPGDAEPGECAVNYFGPGQGGGVEANVERWIGQFQAPDGGPADKLAKTTTRTINGIKVTVVDVTGTYLFRPAPMAPRATPKPGYRMLAAVVEGPQAPVFFKLTAPKKTTDAAEEAFNQMLASLRRE